MAIIVSLVGAVAQGVESVRDARPSLIAFSFIQLAGKTQHIRRFLMAKVQTVKWLATGGLVLGVALMGGTAWATNMFGPNNTCTEINCNARMIQGTLTRVQISPLGPLGVPQPWVAEIFATPGRCLRLAVTRQGADLETVVRAPNGQVFRIDDGGDFPCPRCPVVKIANAPNNGWYTVSLNQFAGTAAGTHFTLLYSLYNLGNPNCADATAPVNALEPDTKSQKSNQFEVSPQQQEEGTPGAQ